MPTNSNNETISAHDEGEDLPRMGGRDEPIHKALREAATSLETIGRLAGRGEFMLEDSDVRAYASNRAAVARAALSAAPQSDGWRPIAEAPKDERVLIAAPGEWVFEARQDLNMVEGEQVWQWVTPDGKPLHKNLVPFAWQPLPPWPRSVYENKTGGGM